MYKNNTWFNHNFHFTHGKETVKINNYKYLYGIWREEIRFTVTEEQNAGKNNIISLENLSERSSLKK